MASYHKIHLHLSVLLLCFVLLGYVCQLVAADCYWPDGSSAPDMHECYGTAGADGLCCAQGDLCLLNHLCQESGTTKSLYRGACNMPDWTQAATCPEICAKPNTGSNLTAAQPVGQCDGLPDQYFCNAGNTTQLDCWRHPPSSDVFTLSGCPQEYNTAGGAMVLTALPTCAPSTAIPGASASSTVTVSWGLGPASSWFMTGSSGKPTATSAANFSAKPSLISTT
ncbi:hypothetical protein VM1G_11957 [Cytospora mali]|uniref:Uncharacterized protein n=1 Tax=Cytospora mali TaxID=578113 RepID=A0A194WDT3_CYTMA|nr:hypothetical protein VM1G_11957 [Valsa mali]